MAATTTLSNVTASASSVTLVSTDAARLGVTLFNDSSSDCYIKYGTTASATNYTYKMGAYDYFEIPTKWRGRIDAIWDSATGAMRVTVVSE